MATIEHPFHPIIYVRGYAMTESEIEATVATPYMGFNLGATKVRQNAAGKVVRHIFESPLVRLMKDYEYRDIYHEGSERSGRLPARSIVVYRYYEDRGEGQVAGTRPTIEEAATGLGELVLQVRDQVCGDDADARRLFRVYLVAHSMGGLVCRAFLQNRALDPGRAAALVDKAFTYATPHGGIEMAGANVPGLLGLWDLNNFNRERMATYLALPQDAKRVDSLNGRFEPERFFCLVGTNYKDYPAAAGISRRLAGEMSDGLVQIAHATVQETPRAFVHRSHSGPFGIVNSEEGYQNLTRFLFGDLRVEGAMEVENLPLPPSVSKALDEGKEVRASYYFESTVSPRGSMNYKLTERRIETNSAVLRGFDEMLRVARVAGLETPRHPVLFSAFLSKRYIERGKTLVFSVDLAVSTTGYEIDGFLMFDHHIPAEYLFRDTVTLRVTPDENGWNIRYVLTDQAWGESRGSLVEEDDDGPFVPLSSRKGFRGKLRLQVSSWH